MADIVASVAGGKLVEYVIDPIVNQFKYLFCYARRIKNLRDELQDLEHKRTRLLHSVEGARRNADIIHEDVLAWLENVDNKKKEAEDVLNIDANSVMWCLKCPNLKFRYLQGRKATKITTTIVELQKKGEFENVGYRKPSSQIPIQVPCNVEGLQTRQSIKKQIIKGLEDEETFIVGICGMPGIGKTTMAKEIASDVKTKFFHEVAFVVVSKDSVLNKVQDHIAEALGQKINEGNEVVRAERLHQRLTLDVEKKILVILDDVWEEIDLGSIGFPPKGAHKGLKILLTSRFESVCRTMKADRVEEVKVLPENEALKLLEDAAGISNDTSEDVKHLAMLVAKECSGLPLSLVVVGKRLINKKEHEWRDKLRILKKSLVGEEKVYRSIEFSYNELKDEGCKSLLLLCSLFPEDHSISIETLVEYAKGLEIFNDTVTLFEMRDRVSSIVDDLKSCYLLLSGYNEYEVKLHDVVRDFCLQTASEGKDVYMVKHNGVKEWPKHDKDDEFTVISLTFDDKLNELPGGLEYPNLKLLRVVCRHKKMNLPDDFFSKMNQLRVVDFNFSSFDHMPSSIQSLTNLQTLRFNWCELKTRLSNIRNLKKLEILSFLRSNIAEFPIEIAHLSNLKSLDLRFAKYPPPFPRDVLSTLNELEELYLGDPFATSRDKCAGFDQVEKEYIIGELSSLKGLQTFQICVEDPVFLLQMLKKMRPKELKRFQIILNRRDRYGLDNRFSKTLLLGDLEASAIKHTVIRDSLLRGTENLCLSNVLGSLKNLVNELDEDGFVNLKTLDLESCSFEYLIELPFNRTSAFSKLERLQLNGLCNLKGVCNGNVTPPSLCSLRNLAIWGCAVIKSLFSESAAKCLLNLEDVVIRNCDMLEHVVARDVAESEVTDLVLEVKKLRYLQLDGVRNLKSFRYQSNVDSKALFSQIAFPNLETLSVGQLHNISKILGDDIQPKALEKLRFVFVNSSDDLRTFARSDSIKALQNLDTLRVSRCSNLDVLFELEGLKVTKDETQSFLSRLTSLQLEGLPKFVHIARRVPKGISVFKNLTRLSIDNCGSLRYLFTPSMASSLAGLETLRLHSCDVIEEIIGGEEEIEMKAVIGEFNKLEFPKLSTIQLKKLASLRMFCCENIELVFPSLNQLTIDKCPNMVKFSSQEQLAPLTLKKLRLVGVNFTSQISWIQDRFPNLEHLFVGEVQCVSKTLSDEIQPKFLEKLRSLNVWNFDDLRTFARSDSIKALQNLDTLRVSRCSNLDVLFELEGLKVTKDETQSFLSRLTSLQLEGLPKFVHIARRVPKGIYVFKNLTSLHIDNCDSLRYLFTPSMASSLAGLETLVLRSCDAIEDIIGGEEEIEMAPFIGEFDKLEFPKLSTIQLEKLASLRMFCCENIELVFPSLNQLTIDKCPNMVKFSSQEQLAPLTLKKLRIAGVNFTSQISWIQDRFPNLEELSVGEVQCVSKTLSDEIQPKFLEKLRSLNVWNFGDVMTIAQSDSIKALQNLDTLRVSRCSNLDVLFELEGLKLTKDETQNILSRLTSLQLEGLPKFAHIARRVPKGICVFQNLTKLGIDNCGSSRYLFTPSMASSFAGLETLLLRSCDAIEEIIGGEEEIEMAAFVGEFNKLEFPKLRTIQLQKLASLRMFCCKNIELVFPSLNQLTIDKCPNMVKFSSQEQLAPLTLKKLCLGGMNFTSEISWIQDRFPNLKEFSVGLVDAFCVKDVEW